MSIKITLSKNIRKLRKNKGISLRKLSEIVELSPSYISQIEQGKVSPSLSSLNKIAQALQSSIGELVGEVEFIENHEIVKIDDNNMKEIGIGRKMFFLTKHSQFKLMEPALVSLDKNATSGEDPSRHFGQEFIYILKGSLDITIDGSTFSLRKGNCIYFDSSLLHTFKNTSNGITEGLWIATPPAYKP